jgi:hypothetical protein
MSDTEIHSPDGQIDAEALKKVKPEDLPRLIASISDEQLEQVMTGPLRRTVLDEIFNRMPGMIDPDAIADTEAVVHFHLLDRPDEHGGGHDEYEVVLENGAATLSEEPSREATVTIKATPLDFFKLAAGRASGPTMFMTGRLKLEGDLMLATRLASFFRIPTAKEE